ncbi:MAG: cytochrome P460 [Nitrospinaceae bacterium]|nr:MAG: cytochrome P460 [Nitrospinaceae bacterium]
MKLIAACLTAVCLYISAPGAYADSGKVEYPEGYRQWVHIKSMLLEPGHPLENPFQGLHHVYGNKNALKGFENGSFPDGSVLVFDLLQYSRGGHAIQEGERKLIGVMKKDSMAFSATGGWGFEAFPKNSKKDRIVKDGGKSCFQCHTSQREHDFVFSRLRK